MYRFTDLRAFALLNVLFLSLAHAQAQGYYPASSFYPIYFETSARLGSSSDIIQADLFLPTLQSEDRLLFVDVQANWLNPSTLQGSAGVGYRCIDWGRTPKILGGSIYFDKNNSENGNDFSQVTAGFEVMSVQWDFRANGYFPRSSPANINAPDTVFSGNSIFLETLQEAPYHGADIEFGRLLADWKDGQIELRAFATGFLFGSNVDGFESISGGRGRLELRLFDLPQLGENSRVMLGAQYQFDNERESVSSCLLSVRVPLGRNGPRQDRLRRRMLNAVVRDSIVTNIGRRREVALDAETGAAFPAISLIDANTVDVPLAIANGESLVIADGSAGEILVSNSLIMQPNQTIRGAGFEVIGADTGMRGVFGSQPTFRGVDPGQSVLQLANNVILRDSNIIGGANGIFGNSVQGFEIDNVSITQSLNSGIELVGAVGGNVLNSRIENSGGDGVRIEMFESGSFDGNLVNANAGSGMFVDTLAGGVISNNAINMNGVNGIEIPTFMDGSVDANVVADNNSNGVAVGLFNGGSLTNNLSQGNALDGFQVDFVEFNVSNQPQIDGNVATGNQIGFHFVTIDGGDTMNNIAENNTSHGFQVDTMSFGSLSSVTARGNGGNGISIGTLTLGTVSDNLLESNLGHGLFLNEITNGLISDNTFTQNGQSGLALNTFSNGQIRDNTSTANAVHGYSVPNFDFGLFQVNSASQNGDDGFNIGSMNFGAQLDENLANANLGDGFEIGSGLWSNGEVNDNIAINNAGFGFNVINRTGGTASGNVATDNGDNTLP